MQTVIDDILTNYQIYGNKNSQALIILHGWRQNITHWPQVALSLGKKYKVFSIDLPGFGASSIPTRPYNTDMYVSFLEAFIDKLQIKSPILLGHSLGGKIAIKYCTETKKTKELILIAPSGIAKKSTGIKIKIFLYKILKASFGWVGNSIKNTISKHLVSDDYKNAGAMKDTFKLIVDDYVTNEAKKITIPTLIIWGEKDKEVPLNTAKELRKLIKSSTLRVLWNTGHSPNLEQPEKLTKLILEYI